jgi:hypothetical protein
VPAQGRPEALVGRQRAAGQRPQALERRRAPLPEQDVQAVATDLEDHGQRLVAEALARRRALLVFGHVRMVLVLGAPTF